MRVRGIGGVVLGLVAACGPVVETPLGEGSGSAGSGSAGSAAATADGTQGGATTAPVGTTTGDIDGTTSERLDLPPDMGPGPECMQEWPNGGCGIPSSRSTVTGTTPLGEFTTPRALFGSDSGCGGVCDVGSNIQRIFLLAEGVPTDDLFPGQFVDETLVIELDAGFGGFMGPIGEPIIGYLNASRGGVTEPAGAIEVVLDVLPTQEELADPFVPRNAVVVTGSITADVPGWSVAGTFAASYCPELNSFAICE